MRPVKLVMSAFGSYGGKEVIDFSDRQQGLFLVAGDTGSGKTTIFDAIMFALFDEMSGSERQGNMMRSEYAKEETDTFVEFTFTYGEGAGKETYTVYRRPSYQRRSKRKNKDGEYGFTSQPALVELTLPDGKVFHGKTKQTNEKLVEIIGLNREQFGKIAMIAQGEFRDLIMESTSKRKEIFQQIFSTQIYEQIEKKILEKQKEMYKFRKESEARLDENLKNVVIDESSQFAQTWQETVKKQNSEPEELLPVLKEIMKEQKQKEKVLTQKVDSLEKQKQEIQGKIDLAKAQNEIILQYEHAKLEKAKLQNQLAEFQKIKEDMELGERASAPVLAQKDWRNTCKTKKEQTQKLEELELLRGKETPVLNDLEQEIFQWNGEYEKEMTPLLGEKSQLEEQMEEYQKRDTLVTNQKKYKEQNQELRRTLETQKKQWEELQNTQEQLQKEIQSNENVPLLLEKQKNRLAQCEEKQDAVAGLVQKQSDIEKMERQLEKNREVLQEKYAAWEQARFAHKKKLDIYLSSQAGIIASTLEEGDSCPVCGGIYHKTSHTSQEELITWEQVQLLEQQVEEKNEQFKKQHDVVNKQESQIETEKQHVLDQAKRIFDGFTWENGANLLAQGEQKAREEVEQCKALVKEYIKKNTILENQKKQVALVEQKLKLKQEELVANQEKEQKQTMYLQKMETQLEELCRKLRFATLKEAAERLKTIENKIQWLKEQKQKEEQKLQQQRDKVKDISGQIKTVTQYREQLTLAEKELYAQFICKLKENGFCQGEEPEQEEKQNFQQAALLYKMVPELRSKWEGFNHSWVACMAKVESLEKNCQGKTQMDTSELVEKKEIVEQQLQEMKELEVNQKIEIERNSNALAKVKVTAEEIGKLLHKGAIINSLNSVANGKTHFQTYIQRYYFKQIIEAANKRLLKMNRKQFFLECRDLVAGGQGENGLDLNVVNATTLKSRDAHTLSGGETFMASLAMALGMADVVQSTVGKIRLDTMFIDEGFGSLSDDARNMSVRVLLELAGTNRLIGVISHVTELKEQIPAKLLVTKGDHGSQVEWSID